MLILETLIQNQNYVFDQDNWNNGDYEYDIKITKAGINRPAGLRDKSWRFIKCLVI